MDELTARIKRPPVARRRSVLGASLPQLCLALPDAPDRNLLERVIAEKFAHQYNARIEHFLPLLLNVDVAGHPGAVAGLRCASKAPLFLEQYLDVPVEQAIARCFHEPVDRSQIVEIGNLVSVMPGAASMLFAVLPQLLENAGFRWASFTATPQVRSMLGKLGFPTETICVADPGVLGDAVSSWGTYYDARPAVIAGDVRTAAKTARENPEAGFLQRSLERPLARLAAELRALRG